MEEKIIDLETRLSFQDQTITELNDVITHQQQQIDHLQEAIRILEARFNEYVTLAPLPDNEPPPPHY